MPIRALIFDLWGTLVEDSTQRDESRRTTRLRLVSAALGAAGHPYSEEAISAAFPSFIEQHDALHGAGRDITAPEKVELFLRCIHPDLPRRLSSDSLRAFEDALIGSIRLHPPLPAPGALEVLAEARRRGLAVALISNTGISPGHVLRDLLAEQGLLQYLQVLTFSDEACFVKPAPEMFHCTLEALGVAPADAVMIGDLPHADVAGALAVGMWAVQVGDKQADNVQPHARIDTLHELFPALERLGLMD